MFQGFYSRSSRSRKNRRERASVFIELHPREGDGRKETKRTGKMIASCGKCCKGIKRESGTGVCMKSDLGGCLQWRGIDTRTRERLWPWRQRTGSALTTFEEIEHLTARCFCLLILLLFSLYVLYINE